MKTPRAARGVTRIGPSSTIEIHIWWDKVVQSPEYLYYDREEFRGCVAVDGETDCFLTEDSFEVLLERLKKKARKYVEAAESLKGKLL